VDIALLGFLPWTDPSRGIAVQTNPAALAAEACTGRLAEKGYRVAFVPVVVSDEGVRKARETVDAMDPKVVVAVGQTKGGPRVERWGRVPGAGSPALPDEEQPWLLAPDAEELAALLRTIDAEGAELEPFAVSDDAGGYFCDNLVVELARWSRRTGRDARFLHVTAIDLSPPDVAQARLRSYECHIEATALWLLSRALPSTHAASPSFTRRMATTIRS